MLYVKYQTTHNTVISMLTNMVLQQYPINQQTITNQTISVTWETDTKEYKSTNINNFLLKLKSLLINLFTFPPI